MTRALVFPGQGSQAVGMGKALAEQFAPARQVFQEVDEALEQPLSRLMFEGPEESLILTENAQPALMAVSMAVVRTLEDELGHALTSHATYVAGHSLGEYSALAAAGAIEISDAARLLKIRGQAMQQAVPVGKGAMAALLGLDLTTANHVATAASTPKEICTAANDNAPGQVVVSGAKVAVQRAVELAKEHGAKRAVLLPVSAPFHCPLMAPAAEAMAEALTQIRIQRPKIPLIANVTANETSDPQEIRRLLVEQVTGMVRWRESVETLARFGVTTLVELGAGKVLTGLTRRIDARLEGVAVNDPDHVATLLAALRAET